MHGTKEVLRTPKLIMRGGGGKPAGAKSNVNKHAEVWSAKQLLAAIPIEWDRGSNPRVWCQLSPT